MPTINGQEYQHANLDISLSSAAGDFVNSAGFKKISWKVEAPKEPVNRADGKIISYVVKPEKTSGSIQMLRSEWFWIRDWHRATNPTVGIGQAEFSLTLTYGVSLAMLRTDVLRMVLFNEESSESSDNQDALMVEIPLFIGEIIPHGGKFMLYR